MNILDQIREALRLPAQPDTAFRITITESRMQIMQDGIYLVTVKAEPPYSLFQNNTEFWRMEAVHASNGKVASNVTWAFRKGDVLRIPSDGRGVLRYLRGYP